MLFYQFNLKLLPHDKLEMPRQLLETVCLHLYCSTLCQDVPLKLEFSIWVLTVLSWSFKCLPVSLMLKIFKFVCLYICGKVGSYKPWYATATIVSTIVVFNLANCRARAFQLVTCFSLYLWSLEQTKWSRFQHAVYESMDLVPNWV